MTGPEHLRYGKRILASLVDYEGDPVGIQANLMAAQAHLPAAQVAAYVAAELPDRVSWVEASEA